jgi:hypothetical protein
VKSRTYVFSCPHFGRYRTLNWPDLKDDGRNTEVPSYRPLALVTARLLARRWPLYLLTASAVFGLQAAFVVFVHVKFADLYAGFIGGPLIITVVTVFAGADATKTLTAAQRWERILERAWAIILLDVGLTFVQGSGIGTMLAGLGSSADAGYIVMGFLTLVLTAMLVYAEPFIALEQNVQMLVLLPFAIFRSMMLAWVNVSRVFSLFAVQLAVAIAAIYLHQWTLKTGASVWADLAFATVCEVPLAALYTVAYLDTLSQERLTLP